jgi:hypothetical protein
VSSDEEDRALTKTTVDAAASAVGALAGFAAAGPFGAVDGAVVGAVAGPVLKGSIDEFISRYGRRRRARVEYVIKVAAHHAGLRPRTLLDRIEQNPEREQLLIRTLQAAQDETQVPHLVALGISLAEADRSGYREEQLTFETAFARAIADCDDAHVKLLRSFVTHDEPRPETNIPPFGHQQEGLSTSDLEIARQELQLGNTLDYLVATLERVGLVRPETVDLPSPPIISRTVAYWRITDFGLAFVERLDQVMTLFAEH